MATPNDTTTALNPGSGGDSMNESNATLFDGQSKAKAPRVVLMLDDGTLVEDLEGLPVRLADADRELLEGIHESLKQLVRLNGGIT